GPRAYSGSCHLCTFVDQGSRRACATWWKDSSGRSWIIEVTRNPTRRLTRIREPLWPKSCIYKHQAGKIYGIVEDRDKNNSRSANAVAICEFSPKPRMQLTE